MKVSRYFVVFCALLLSSALAQTEVLLWTSHGEPDLSAIRAIADQYNSEHDDIQVNVVQVQGDETDVTKLMTAVRGGTGPDIYMLDRFVVAQRAADGLLQDLSPYMGDMAGEPLAEYLDFARQEAMLAGVPYALPFDTDARALYYNIDILEEVGVDASILDPANGPVSMDIVLEIAAQVDQKNSQGNYERMGFVPWHEQGWHYTYGFSHGGDFYDAETCQVTPDDPNVVAAFQWAYDYAAEKGPQQVQAFRQAFTRPDLPPQQNPFMTGQLAMVITGDWMISGLRRYAPDLNYGITFIPTFEGQDSATWAGGWSLVMPQGANNPEAAYDVMSYMAGEPGQRLYTSQSQHLPTITSLLEDESLYESTHLFFRELLPLAKSRPPLPVGALYWDELSTAWEKAYLNQEDPQSALEQVASRVNPQLQPFCAQLTAGN
jgi:multiple sugar transport system substrate-binding protein